MADRYNILKKKPEEVKAIKTVDDGIADDIRELYKPEQTLNKSKFLSLRGPNGFQALIPVRNIKFHRGSSNIGYELHLEIPQNLGRAIEADILQADTNANARERVTNNSFGNRTAFDYNGLTS